MPTSWLGPVAQISITTEDLAAALVFWEQRIGLGPFEVFRNLTLVMRHEGRALRLPVHVALGLWGDTVLELMEVAGPGPSPFHDGLGRRIIGLQRLASVSAQYAADVARAEAAGMEKFAEGGEDMGQLYAYFRAPEAPGVILEILEETVEFTAFTARLRARARAYKRVMPSPPPAVIATAALPAGMMRAMLLDGYGGVDQFRLAEIPEPVPGPGEIRVRVAAVAVNPVDIKLRAGILHRWLPLAFPVRLGGDVAGIVDAVGEGVVGFAPGDAVLGQINPARDGGYGEKIVFWEQSFIHLPQSLAAGRALQDAAALPTGVLTGTQLVENAIRPTPGQRVLVTGAGGSAGRAAVYAACDCGAAVYAGVRAGGEAAVADLPVSGVIDLGDHAAIASAAPFDAIADTVGGTVAEVLFPYLRPRGVFASIVVPAPIPPQDSDARMVSMTVAWDGARLTRFLHSLARGERHMPVAHRLTLDQAGRAHQMMEAGGVGGKILLLP